MILGPLTYFLLADNPETAAYLNGKEIAFCIKRLSCEASVTKSAKEFHWKDVRACFVDWKCWAFAIAQFGEDTMLYGYGVIY